VIKILRKISDRIKFELILSLQRFFFSAKKWQRRCSELKRSKCPEALPSFGDGIKVFFNDFALISIRGAVSTKDDGIMLVKGVNQGQCNMKL
jgi:hypothetical protein